MTADLRDLFDVGNINQSNDFEADLRRLANIDRAFASGADTSESDAIVRAKYTAWNDLKSECGCPSSC